MCDLVGHQSILPEPDIAGDREINYFRCLRDGIRLCLGGTVQCKNVTLSARATRLSRGLECRCSSLSTRRDFPIGRDLVRLRAWSGIHGSTSTGPATPLPSSCAGRKQRNLHPTSNSDSTCLPAWTTTAPQGLCVGFFRILPLYVTRDYGGTMFSCFCVSLFVCICVRV